MALYFIDSFGNDPQLLVKGIAQTLSIAKTSQYLHGAFASYSKDKVRRSRNWKDAIGEIGARNLTKGEVSIDGCTFYLLTPRIDPSEFIQGPILAYGLDPTFLQRVLYHPCATDIVYVPWTQDERDHFKSYHPDAIRF